MKDQRKFKATVFKLDFILKAAVSIRDLKKGVKSTFGGSVFFSRDIIKDISYFP